MSMKALFLSSVILMVAGLEPSLAQPPTPPPTWGWDLEILADPPVLVLSPSQTSVSADIYIRPHSTDWGHDPNYLLVWTFHDVTLGYAWDSPPGEPSCDYLPGAPTISFTPNPVSFPSNRQAARARLTINVPDLTWPCIASQRPLHITASGQRFNPKDLYVPYVYEPFQIGILVCNSTPCLVGRAIPDLMWDYSYAPQSDLIFQSATSFSTTLQLTAQCCVDAFSGQLMPDNQINNWKIVNTDTSQSSWSLPLTGYARTTVNVLPTQSSFGQFNALVQVQCAGCPSPWDVPITFVNLPPLGDEALTNCLPWNGPSGTPAPWGGANATPPQLWQTWQKVQSMIAQRWEKGSVPFDTTIFVGAPQASLDHFQSCPTIPLVCSPNTEIDWLVEDDPTGLLNISTIVFINNAASAARVTAWRSDRCSATGNIDVSPGQTASMTISVPDQGFPTPAATTLFFSRQVDGHWYDIGILGEKAFWSIARGRKMTFTWTDY